MNLISITGRLAELGLLSWGEKCGLVEPIGHGVRDNPKRVICGFCFERLRYTP